MNYKPLFSFITILFMGIILSSCGQKDNPQKVVDDTSKSTTGSTLGKRLGADEYGYKPYVIVFIKQSHRGTKDQKMAADLQKKHLKYLKTLLDAGDLILLGPVLEEAEISGICVYKSQKIDEVRKLAMDDPAVKKGEFVIEAHPWYGPAALMKVPGINKPLEKKSFADM